MTRKKRLFKISLALCAFLASCAGPSFKTNVCTFSQASHGFFCSYDGGSATFLAFESGKDLVCYQPDEFSKLVVSCKKGVVIYSIPVKDVTDGCICTPSLDLTRLLERCDD